MRIVEAAARLIYERGVTATTIDEVKASAEVGGSQLYHYFADKEELVREVVNHQADLVVDTQRRADFSSAEGLEAWRSMIINHVTSVNAMGGCPLGALGGQLAESDPEGRALVAAGFERWADAISEGLRALRAAGHLTVDINSDDLAITLLAAIQGGLLLAQVRRSSRPLEIALNTLLALLCDEAGNNPDLPMRHAAPGALTDEVQLERGRTAEQNRRAEAAEREAGRAHRSLEQLLGQLTAARETNDRHQNELLKVATELATTTAQLAATRDQVDTEKTHAAERIADQRQRIEAAEHQVQRLRTDLEQQRACHNSEIEDLHRQLAELRRPPESNPPASPI